MALHHVPVAHQQHLLTMALDKKRAGTQHCEVMQAKMNSLDVGGREDVHKYIESALPGTLERESIVILARVREERRESEALAAKWRREGRTPITLETSRRAAEESRRTVRRARTSMAMTSAAPANDGEVGSRS